ncbi:MAG: universal stress protein [Chlorobium sp.]|nr:MAG: universal stress protein [Chlorobium sp.]
MEKKDSQVRKIILCPVDFSGPSEMTLKHIGRYYSKDADLQLVYVCNRNPADCDDSGKKNLYRLFSRYIQILNSFDCNYHLDIQGLDGYNSPADAIIAFAKSSKADTIAIGSHGETGIPYLLMGSTAETVLRNADCPVLLIKTLHEEAAANDETDGQPEESRTEDMFWF